MLYGFNMAITGQFNKSIKRINPKYFLSVFGLVGYVILLYFMCQEVISMVRSIRREARYAILISTRAYSRKLGWCCLNFMI